MITTTETLRTFEVGDLFFFTDKPASGGIYEQGDFLLITHINPYLIKFTTRYLLNGTCHGAGGDSNYLNQELDAGVLEYQGNILLGKSE